MDKTKWLQDPKFTHFEGYTTNLISLKQWAIAHNYSYSYTYKLIYQRRIKAYKFNRRWWIEP